MANRYDILSDEDGDIVVSGGDLLYDISDDQHVQDIIKASPGYWKQFFTDGVSILSYLKGRGIEQELVRKIKIQLSADNYTSSPSVSWNGQTLIINPNVDI